MEGSKEEAAVGRGPSRGTCCCREGWTCMVPSRGVKEEEGETRDQFLIKVRNRRNWSQAILVNFQSLATH